MARGRMLNQRIAEDIDFNEMSMEAQFIFMRTIPFLDKDGLIAGHPTLLWSKVAPLLPEFATKMQDIIDEWVQAGFVMPYQDGKSTVLFFVNFSKNQSGMRYDREGESEYAPPPGYTRTARGLVLTEELTQQPEAVAPSTNDEPEDEPSEPVNQECEPSPAELRQESGATPLEVKEKLKETKQQHAGAREAELPVEGWHDWNEHTHKQNGGSGGGSPRHRQTNSDYGQLCTAIESNGFGFMTSLLADEANALLDEYPLVWILDALKVAVGANKRQLRYVRGILVKWRADGRDPATSPAAPPPPPKPAVYQMPPAAAALKRAAELAAQGVSY